MLILGGGIIGLEMGTVYSTLGARLDVVVIIGAISLNYLPSIWIYAWNSSFK